MSLYWTFNDLSTNKAANDTIAEFVRDRAPQVGYSARILYQELRRQRGYGRGARQAIETDRAEIVSGVRHGLTLGSPILLLVRNRTPANPNGGPPRAHQVEILEREPHRVHDAVTRGALWVAAVLLEPLPQRRDLGFVRALAEIGFDNLYFRRLESMVEIDFLRDHGLGFGDEFGISLTCEF